MGDLYTDIYRLGLPWIKSSSSSNACGTGIKEKTTFIWETKKTVTLNTSRAHTPTEYILYNWF